MNINFHINIERNNGKQLEWRMGMLLMVYVCCVACKCPKVRKFKQKAYTILFFPSPFIMEKVFFFVEHSQYHEFQLSLETQITDKLLMHWIIVRFGKGSFKSRSMMHRFLVQLNVPSSTGLRCDGFPSVSNFSLIFPSSIFITFSCLLHRWWPFSFRSTE